MSEKRTVPLNLSLDEHLVEKLGELHSEFGITLSSLVMSLLEQPVDHLLEVVMLAHENKIPPLRDFTKGGKPLRATKHNQPVIRDYLVSLGQFNSRKADVFNRAERNYE